MKREHPDAIKARARKLRFLQYFRRYGIVAIAARRVGVTRQIVYRDWLKSEKFKTEFEAIQSEWVDKLEAEVVKLGTGQYSRKLVSGGAIVGEEPIRDLKALEMLLKAYRPKLFAPTLGVQVTGGTSHEIKVKKEVTAAMVAEVAKLVAEAGVVLPDHEGDYSALDDFRFRARALPAFQPPASEANTEL